MSSVFFPNLSQRNSMKSCFTWMTCLVFLVSVLEAAPKNRIKKSFSDSFDNFNESQWSVEGKATIEFGRAVFTDQKKSYLRCKEVFKGSDWKTEFLIKFGLTKGEFYMDLLQEDAKSSALSAMLTWIDNEGDAEIDVSINNNLSGKPVTEKLNLKGVAMDQWQKIKVEKTAHKVLVYLNNKKLTELVWKDGMKFNFSAVTGQEITIDDFSFTHLKEHFHILDSVSIPGYGEPIQGWENLSGEWGAIFLPRSRQKVVSQTANLPGVLYYKDAVGGDFELSVDCRIEQGKMIGVGLVSPDGEEQYRFIMESENSVGLRIEYVKDDNVKLLDRSEKTIFPGVWNQVKIKQWNGYVSIWFDGQEVFEGIKVPYGLKPCLLTLRTQSALFRNLTINEELPNDFGFGERFKPMVENDILSPSNWESKMSLNLKGKKDVPAKLNFLGLAKNNDYRMSSKIKLAKNNPHVIFELSSGLDRAEFHILKQQNNWYAAKLVKEKGDREEVPVNADIEKILFSNMNQDLSVIELEEITDVDLHTNVGLRIRRDSGGGRSRLSFHLSEQNLGTMGISAKGGSLTVSMLTKGIVDIVDLECYNLNRNFGAWLKQQNLASQLFVEEGEMTIKGGTFDERSLQEGKFFAFSPLIHEAGEFSVRVSARSGEGKVGFFLEDLAGDTYELGSLSLAENDASVWIDPKDETKGIKREKDDTSPEEIRFVRKQQTVEIYVGEQMLGSQPLYTSIPMRLYLTRLSGSYKVHSTRNIDRSVSQAIDFRNKTWLKTSLRPIKASFDIADRMESADNWSALSLYGNEGSGESIELKPKLPSKFVLNFDTDYRAVSDLDFEHEVQLKGEENLISIKVLQLEEGVELLLSINGEIKFRKPYLSKNIDYNFIHDGEKFGIYTNGFLIGEEKMLTNHKWKFETKVESSKLSSVRLSSLKWNKF